MPYRRVSKISFAAALVAALGFSVFTATEASAGNPLQFGHIQYNSAGKDTTGNLNGEYVVIKNTGSYAINLKGMRVADKLGHTYVFPSFVVGSKRAVTLHTGKGTNKPGHVYWGNGWHIWNNAKPGDIARLKYPSPSKAVSDTCSWPGDNSKQLPGYVTCKP